MDMNEFKKLVRRTFIKSNNHEGINNHNPINNPMSTKSESALEKELVNFETTKLLSKPPNSLSCRIRRFNFKNHDCFICQGKDLEQEKNLSHSNNNLEVCHTHHHRHRNYIRYLITILLLIIIFIIIYLPIHFHKIKNQSTSKEINYPNSCSNSNTNPDPISNLTFNVPIKESFTPEEYRNSWTITPTDNLNSLEYDMIEPIDLEGKGKGWTIIFLHGLGDLNATQSYQFKDYLNSDLSTNPFTRQEIGQLTGLRYIIPKAPFRPITVFDHEIHRGWFDIKDWRDLNFLEDEDGLKDSSIKVFKIIKDLIDRGQLNMDFTILAGFSQGAVMSFLLTLVLPQPPFATLIMSGYPTLPFRWPILTSSNQNQYKKTSIYFIHGILDQVLDYNKSKFGFKLFQSTFNQKFKQIKFKTFLNLSHNFNFDELILVTNWIQGIVQGQSGGGFDQKFDEFLAPENDVDDFIG